MDKQLRYLNLKGATGKIRTAKFQNREHVVLPVVGLVEGVIHPVNAPAPEFAPARALARAPGGWNGRPVFCGHPLGGDSSGNTPEILETAFGLLFNTSSSEKILSSKKLEFEAWLDPSKAEEVGEGPVRILERVKNDDMIEVSVGAYILGQEKKGEYKGKKYEFEWEEVVPDHLALLEEGDVGACSNKMGCGTPRTARAHLITAAGIEIVEPEMTEIKTAPPGARDWLLFRANRKIESNRDLMRALDKALRAIEPGYLGIDDVFPNDNLVVYAVAPGDEFYLLQRGYTVKGESVELKDKSTKVEPVTRYEPVKAASENPTTAETHGDCSCGNKNNKRNEENMDKKQRVLALINNPKTPFTAEDEAMLMTASDARLEALTAEADKPASPSSTPPAPTPPTTERPQVPVPSTPPPTPAPGLPPVNQDPNARGTTTAAAAPQSEEEWLKTAPDSVRKLVADAKARETAERTTIVSSLKGKQDAYTEAELNEMPIDQLRKVAKLAKVNEETVDFTGLGAFRENRSSSEDSNVIPAPPSLDAKLKELRASESKRTH